MGLHALVFLVFFDSLHILQWIYIWNPFLVGKMRFIQNIKKIESSSPLRKPVQYANRFMKWLFTGELAFDMLFIQLSWHCGKITFFCLFLIHTFIQFTNSNGANTTRSCRAAERTMHWNNVQIWAFQCAQHRRDTRAGKHLYPTGHELSHLFQ